VSFGRLSFIAPFRKSGRLLKGNEDVGDGKAATPVSLTDAFHFVVKETARSMFLLQIVSSDHHT
jgi:hypothetical protein